MRRRRPSRIFRVSASKWCSVSTLASNTGSLERSGVSYSTRSRRNARGRGLPRERRG
jgi:hypothetical protein